MTGPREPQESLIAMAGILIARHRCSPEHARHLLGAAAQRNRLTLTDVASDLVRRTSGREPPGS